MIIRMKVSRWVSPNGCGVRYVCRHERYVLPEHLASWLVRQHYAVIENI